jgi:outer membrane biosynthesis protein TonB
MALSVVLHSLIILLGWASTRYQPDRMEFLTYQIELVSPPPSRQAEVPEVATEELVVERPEPDPPPPDPEPEAAEVVPVEKPKPDPPPEKPADPTPRPTPETAEETRIAATPAKPVTESAESGENLNVRIEGLRRDYPQYYENIIRQIQRCFRWSDGGNWETTVFFYIDRDGVAADVQFVTRSGNVTFDFQSMGAVECAGQGRFGPLPADVPYDRFPVRFRFRPAGAPDEPGTPTISTEGTTR